ncbi:response regulator [Flavobacterium faecale]|uniref:Response regulator n=1 Tax=Flavobacterium faecale TaxID=1355330 RepID=A0A2S1LE13_9FLAO|nr:response regulator transcription factor [Flavobacterium faecale]AWG21979.1 response regulator [Flavobacterium faecale]
MFKKVLITDDLDIVCDTVQTVVRQLSIDDIHLAAYCDDAYLKIKKSLIEKKPFDLLITDLSFKDNFQKNNINNGEDLIASVKKIQPSLKIIVFSVEDKSYRIRSLFEKYAIDGYIIKGRDSIPNLSTTIVQAFSNIKPVMPIEIEKLLKEQQLIEIEDYDIFILKLMAKGNTLGEISAAFKSKKIQPSSPSSIEKRITKLKVYFKAVNNVQLIATTKDLGLL